MADAQGIMSGNADVPSLVHARAFGVADFNYDGIPDVLISSHGFDESPYPTEKNILLLSQPDGKYIDSKAVDTNFDYLGFTHSHAIGDINSDSFPDIVFVDLNGPDVGCEVVRILLNNGSADFTRLDFIDSTSEYHCSFWTSSKLADLNSDGFPDLILGGGDKDNSSVVFWNDTTGGFSESAPFSPSLIPPVSEYGIVTDIEVVDLDDDGFLDMLLARTKDSPSYSGRYIQALKNNKDGTFTDITSEVFDNDSLRTGRWIVEMLIVDLNSDGEKDIVLQYDLNDNYTKVGTSVLLKEGGAYVPFEAIPIPGGLVPIDFDNDNDVDLLVLEIRNFGSNQQSIDWNILENTTK